MFRNFIMAIPVVALAIGGTTACASKKFVRTSVGEVNEKVDSQGRTIEETQERVAQERGTPLRGRSEGRRGAAARGRGATPRRKPRRTPRAPPTRSARKRARRLTPSTRRRGGSSTKWC